MAVQSDYFGQGGVFAAHTSTFTRQGAASTRSGHRPKGAPSAPQLEQLDPVVVGVPDEAEPRAALVDSIGGFSGSIPISLRCSRVTSRSSTVSATCP